MSIQVVNELTFEGDNAEVKLLMNSVKMTGPKVAEYLYTGVGTIDFRKIIPCPPCLFMGNLGPEEEKKTGNHNWYNWNRKYWGVKKNANNCFRPREGRIKFLTDCAAPLPVIIALSWLFKDVRITFRWASEQLGENCGEAVLLNGELEDAVDFDGAPKKEAVAYATNLWKE